MICAIELVGPCRVDPTAPMMEDPWGNLHPTGRQHPRAWIQIAAVTKEQTQNTMRCFHGLFSKALTRKYRIVIDKTQVSALKGAIFIQAVTSSWRALEGGRPTLQIQNETQHWNASNEGLEMVDVMERNATKGEDGNTRTLKITNAYHPNEDSVAQRDRDAWEMEESGDSIETGVMYDSIEAPEDAIMVRPKDVSTEDFITYLEMVVDSVRGDSYWLKPRVIVKSILNRKNPVARSRRFYFNQITATEDAWLDPKAITAGRHELMTGLEWDSDVLRRGWGLVSSTDPVVLFGDGSKSDDETGIVGMRLSDGYEFVVGNWFRPPRLARDEDWLVDRHAVDVQFQEARKRFNIVAFWFDPGHIKEDDSENRYFQPLLDKWHREMAIEEDSLQLWAVRSGPGMHSILWDMTSKERQETFTIAAEEFVGEIQQKDPFGRYAPTFRHDGHPALMRHLKNARKYPNAYGTSLWKGSRESAKKIDLAVCAVGARMLGRLMLNKGLEKSGAGQFWGGGYRGTSSR